MRRTRLPVCGQSGWLEILGSGMVDPAVFQNVNYDSEEYSGLLSVSVWNVLPC